MPRSKGLKDGTKVNQEFSVKLAFTAQEGDTPYCANDLIEFLGGMQTENLTIVDVVVKKIS